MRRIHTLILTLVAIAIFSCEQKNTVEKTDQSVPQLAQKSPKEMLNEAYQLFKEGNDEESIKIANKVLEIGRAQNNDTLIGGALSSLCRNAQRNLDTIRLEELSEELIKLSNTTGNKQWLMKRAHMNAEMWRLIGNMDKAELFYDESMQISNEIGAKGMFMIDHFNKSFVSTAKGDFKSAKELIQKYYQLRVEAGYKTDDAYGLIALAYLLEQQGNYIGAHEVAVVTRRLFTEQNLFPEPPDEKPLLIVENKVVEMLDKDKFEEIKQNSTSTSVSNLLDKYLKN